MEQHMFSDINDVFDFIQANYAIERVFHVSTYMAPIIMVTVEG